jgi:hypothetical protein
MESREKTKQFNSGDRVTYLPQEHRRSEWPHKLWWVGTIDYQEENGRYWVRWDSQPTPNLSLVSPDELLRFGGL